MELQLQTAAASATHYLVRTRAELARFAIQQLPIKCYAMEKAQLIPRAPLVLADSHTQDVIVTSA